MNDKNYIVCGLVLAHALTGYAQADDAVEEELLGLYGSEEFISIAAGYKQPINKAPAVASIITSEQIRKAGATDLDEVLEMLPGLHVSVNQQGYFPIYSFRGIYSNFNPQVLVLIDGVPQTNLFTGGKHLVWGGFPVEAIDRVEIIRGPGSAIYGADAFAGVINIITKGSESFKGVEAGYRHGNLAYRDYFISYGGNVGNAGVGFFLEHTSNDRSSEKIESDAQSFLDLVTGTVASLAPSSLNLGIETTDIRSSINFDDLSISFGYQGRRDGESGVGVAQALDPTSRFESDRYFFSVQYDIEDLIDDYSLSIAASYLDFSQEVERDVVLFPPGSTGPSPVVLGFDSGGNPIYFQFENGVIGNPEVYERHSRLEVTNIYEGFDNHHITLGVGYFYGDLYKIEEEKNYCLDDASCAYLFSQGSMIGGRPVDVSDTPFVFLREDSRENYHAYIQDVYRFANDWELTAGVRYDNYSDFGDTVNPRLALVWSTTRKLTTKFLYGEAFRAPSFSETRNINNPAALGNPDLDPETLKSFELVFDYKPIKGLEYIVNTFYYEWKDIIQFVPDPVSGVNVAQNAGRQTGYGLEAEFRWSPVSELELAGNFSVQKSTNENTNEDAANSPQRQVYLQANWMLADNWNLNVQGNWVMDRKREASDMRSPVDDYATVDFSLRRSNLFEGLEIALHVKNLFDEDAREPSQNGVPVALIPNDLPLPGRRIIGELRYSF